MPLYIAIGIVGLVIVFLVVVATRPAAFRIERTGDVAAPPEVVFGMLNDFHLWEEWSPWQKLDLTMKKTYEGAPSGVGSIFRWVGNKKVGEGRMTNLENKPREYVTIKLEFLKPFAATNTAKFTLTPTNGGTRVNWGMEGRHNFMGKAFCMFMDMDKMVGKDFERGLANLDGAARARMQASHA